MPQPKSCTGLDDDMTVWLLLQLSCMWEDIRWLRQSVPISMSSSTVLQTRQKMLAATAQLQVRGQVSTQTCREIWGKLGQFSSNPMRKRKRGLLSRSEPSEAYEGFSDSLSCYTFAYTGNLCLQQSPGRDTGISLEQSRSDTQTRSKKTWVLDLIITSQLVSPCWASVLSHAK